MKKVFKVAYIRDLLNLYHNEEITFSKMCELLNEAVKFYDKYGEERMDTFFTETTRRYKI